MNRIGIDIGGTSAKLGLVDGAGTVLRRTQTPTGRDLDGDALVERLVEAVASLQTEETAAGLGVAAPGFRRADGEGVVNVSNMPLIDGYPLRTRLEERTGLPTVLDNDANAAAMGEHRFGGGQGVARLLVMTVGTGIGAGMVVDGAVHRVSWEGLGDPGHVLVQAGGRKCACGAHGCMETVAGVPAIVRHASELASHPYAHIGEVVQAAREGRGPAAHALADAGRWLGMGLATLVHVLGPDRILLGGGGLDAAEELLMEPIRNSLFAHVQPFLGERLTLARAALGNDAGLVGAAALADVLGGR